MAMNMRREAEKCIYSQHCNLFGIYAYSQTDLFMVELFVSSSCGLDNGEAYVMQRRRCRRLGRLN